MAGLADELTTSGLICVRSHQSWRLVLKLISVIVPAYNVDAFLGATLDSLVQSKVLGQVEVIVVDDGSTDGTGTVCASYVAQYPGSIRYVRKENGHYGSAVNTGISEAEGKYLRIVDGDDCVDPGGLESLVRFLEQGVEADAVISDYAVVNSQDGTRSVCTCDIMPDVALDFSRGDRITEFGMHAVVYRRSLFTYHGIRLTEGVPYTDQEYVVLPLPYVRSMVYHPGTVYVYNLGRDGQSVSPESVRRSLPAHRQVLDGLFKWYQDLDRSEIPDSINHLIDTKIGHLAQTHMRFCAGILDLGAAREEIMRIEKETEFWPGVRHRYSGPDIKLLRRLRYHGMTFWLIARRVRYARHA